jgi:pimeloyl-ACP methyl ester carboxylesterase
MHRTFLLILAAGMFLSCAQPPEQPAAVEAPEPLFAGDFAEVGGTKTYYEELGSGPPMVLIHGGLVDRRMWDEQFALFAERYRVIRYDVRWHGQSIGDGKDHSLEEDLYALLQHLEVERAVIVGLSLGGRIGIDFTLRHPEMVSALIVVGPGLSGFEFVDTENSKNNRLLVEAWQNESWEEAVEYFQRNWTDGPSRAPEDVDPEVREKVRAMAAENIRVPMDGKGRAMRLTPPAVEVLEMIEAPTLLILGELDMPDIFSIGELITSRVEGAEKVVIPGAAHMVNMEKPEEFNRAVLEFLEGL